MAEVQKIEQLLRLERYYRDTQHWAEWRECYHPDSSKTFVNISWYKGQIDEWVERSRNLRAAGVTTLHTVSPIEVKIRARKAYAISGCHIVARFPYNEAEYDLVALLRLVSRLEYVHGQGWKILSLEGIYLQDSIIPVLPVSLPSSSNNGSSKDPKSSVATTANFDMSSLKNLRPSYQCLIWNIERKGMPARRDLPGADDPASVQAILDHCQEWIESGTGTDGDADLDVSTSSIKSKSGLSSIYYYILAIVVLATASWLTMYTTDVTMTT